MRKFTYDEFCSLSAYLQVFPETDSFKTFSRCKKNNICIYSQSHSRCKIRNSYTVTYVKNERTHIGQVMFFFQCKRSCPGLLNCSEFCICPVHNLAMVKVVHIQDDQRSRLVAPEYGTGFHIKQVVCTNSLTVVPISDIMNKCCFISFKDKTFISLFPNNCERD